MQLRVFVDLALPPDALSLLEQGTRGHHLMLSQRSTSVLTRAAPDPQLNEADVAFGQPDPDFITKCPKLRWVHIASSGITRYDTPEFRSMAGRRGLSLSNSARVYQEPCALHALSFLLAQARELPEALATQTPAASTTWDRLRAASVPLANQTLLIAGYGSIGERLAELVRPLHIQVLAYRRRPRGNESVPLVSPEKLPAALASADHVMNILPLSAETHHFFNRQRFAEFKPGAVFYNIGRGATVDQAALLDALRTRHLKAAWLDVTDPEPLPADHSLLGEARCHITPHVAGGHRGEAQSLVRHFLSNLQRFLRQDALLDRVL